jgi:hypothetical protein
MFPFAVLFTWEIELCFVKAISFKIGMEHIVSVQAFKLDKTRNCGCGVAAPTWIGFDQCFLLKHIQGREKYVRWEEKWSGMAVVPNDLPIIIQV